MTILYLEDDAADAALVRAHLEPHLTDCHLVVAPSFAAFEAALHGPPPDLILADFKVHDGDGLTALRTAKATLPDTPFILLSGTIEEDVAIEFIRNGAQDYVLKGNIKRLPVAIQRAVREAHEQRLYREARHRLVQQGEMIEQANEAIVIADLAGHVISWNRGAERIFGWTLADVVGRRLRDVAWPEDAAAIIAASEASVQSSAWRGELQLHTKAGKEITIEVHHTLVLDEAGRPKARLTISTDITEKKLLEAQFAQAQRMENIGLLATGIAHDLNNMLAPILMAAPLLRSATTEPRARRMLDTVEQCAERGAALTRQILSFAQGSAGQLKLVQIKHLLRDIVNLVQQTFPRSIKLEADVPNDLWLIQANPVQIHQVLLNLCVNARDAMPHGGRLSLRVRNTLPDEIVPLGPDASSTARFVVIDIADTGTGIPPEVLPHIWKPFFTTKEQGHGTGLGLPTVKGIIGNHQGHIIVQTEAGQGTLFRVILPASPDGADRPESSTALPRGAGELIVVVDDEAHIQQLCSTILTRQGYDVLVASDAADAVGWFSQRSHEVRLVLTDLQMPDFDGLALSRVLSQINSNIKMLVITGLPTAEQRLRDAPPCIKGLLLKPFTAEALIRQVHAILHPPASHDLPPS
ncbi:response regulator [Horticoccus luteus]|uniref:histidine kinase n=1 Tax=Horticoccus luteus TaxID=2862869 RepID=A0A8F9TS61_9BACT|nr:response regulator [Horticoccus luteus]QYM78031.1 response regulator [Horticoccus luteus]